MHLSNMYRAAILDVNVYVMPLNLVAFSYGDRCSLAVYSHAELQMDLKGALCQFMIYTKKLLIESALLSQNQ